MSVSDPLIKELKGHVAKLHSSEKPIKDKLESLLSFCKVFEKIITYGLNGKYNYLGVHKRYDPWQWIEKIANDKYGVPYAFVSSVVSVRRCRKVLTNVGRLRLFIRTALMNRCLHIPIQTLIRLDFHREYYNSTSIVSNEILAEVLTSLLMICSRIQFDLNLASSRFLDETWSIPDSKKLTVVPCSELGLSILFVSGVPLITSVVPDSVADDAGGISIGDILDEINERTITASDEGTLSNLIRFANGPISLHVLKGGSRGTVFPPLIRILKEADLDPAAVASLSLPSPTGSPITRPGPNSERIVTYLGSEETGSRSDIKQLHFAISRFLTRLPSGSEIEISQKVYFSFHDLGVKIKMSETEEVLFEHSFMEITCCGATSSIPEYFAYIAGNKEYTSCKDFQCYVFHSSNYVLIEKICRSIAQGFKRTLCTV